MEATDRSATNNFTCEGELDCGLSINGEEATFSDALLDCGTSGISLGDTGQEDVCGVISLSDVDVSCCALKTSCLSESSLLSSISNNFEWNCRSGELCTFSRSLASNIDIRRVKNSVATDELTFPT